MSLGVSTTKLDKLDAKAALKQQKLLSQSSSSSSRKNGRKRRKMLPEGLDGIIVDINMGDDEGDGSENMQNDSKPRKKKSKDRSKNLDGVDKPALEKKIKEKKERPPKIAKVKIPKPPREPKPLKIPKPPREPKPPRVKVLREKKARVPREEKQRKRLYDGDVV